MLRELGRRWGDAVRTLLIEDPDDEVLDQLRVTVFPTWLRFTPDEGGSEAGRLRVEELRGRGTGGEQLMLPGPWRLAHRRTGALPKHEVEAEFGPSA